ncbi:MAG: hypothetical protein ACRDVW_00580 [Acidimicrobiales bacterium]
MAVVIKPGARLRSRTCTTEVVVVRAGGEDLRCGGVAMLEIGSAGAAAGTPMEGFDTGTEIGKRYADEASGLEVLCTKAGTGSLSLGETPLQVVGAKPLPASD